MDRKSFYNPPTKGRTASRVVAASDTPARLKSRADYICDGVADDVEIRQAIKDVLNLSNGLTHHTSESTVIIPGINFALVYYDGTNYYAYGGDATYANIVCSSSADGITWTDPVVVLAKGSESSVAVATVWKESTTWYMLYRASGNKVNLATTTTSATEGWTNYGSNPVINDGVAQDPAGLIKVDSTYYLVTNTTGGDREINIYTSTNRTSWTKVVGSPIFTGSRYCSSPFVYNGTYYLIVSRYYDGGVGSLLELWSCPNPKFLDGQRTFEGVLVFDATHESVDTPSIITLDITRSTFPDDKFQMYYSKKITGGSAGITYPALLCEEATVPAAIAKAVKPGTGRVVLLEGTYNVDPPLPNHCIDVPYGVILEGNNSTIKMTTGINYNMSVPAFMSVDNNSIVRNLIIDGNAANVTGTHYGVCICRGGLVENCIIQGWKSYGVYYNRGEMRGGKIRRNPAIGGHCLQFGTFRNVDVLGNGSANANPGLMLASYARVVDCNIHNNYTGIGILNTSAGIQVKGGKIYENLYWGINADGTTSTIMLDGVLLHDNAGYSTRGQISAAGTKIMMLGCTLTDYRLSQTYQMYCSSAVEVTLLNCFVLGDDAAIYDGTGGKLTQVNTTATL